MSLLARVMLHNNALILLPALLVGTGIYILTDLFERLDNFIEAQLGFEVVLAYFVYKIPLIISQILPVVFLLTTVIQICLMSRQREMTALYAGGVSPLTILRLMFLCGVIWGSVQFGFSQWLGVVGEQRADRIWQEQVHNRTLSNVVLRNLWFTDQSWIVSMGTLNADNTGTNLLAYKLSADGLSVEEVVRAAHFTVDKGNWQLKNVSRTLPGAFVQGHEDSMTLDLRQNLEHFRIVGSQGAKPQQLSVRQLGEAIEVLQASGSNVEVLRTVWHSKISYAASLAVLALVAMAVAAWKDNIYIASGMALVITFIYYALYTVANTLGQQGHVPPFVAAWMANILCSLAALIKLAPLLIGSRRR